MPPPSVVKFLPTDATWLANPSVDFIMGHRSLQMGLRFYKRCEEVDKLDHEKCIRDMNYAGARRMTIKGSGLSFGP